MSVSFANDSRARPNVSRSCIVAITVLRQRPRRPPPARRARHASTSPIDNRRRPPSTSPMTGGWSAVASVPLAIVARRHPRALGPQALLQISQRRRPHVRRRRGRSKYDRRRRHRVPAALDEQLGDTLDAAQAHHHDDGRAVRREALEHRAIRVLGVTRDDDEAGRQPAMGHRDAGERGGGDRRAHARHDLERNPGGRERQPLFAAAAEDERVPALEAHDLLARPGRRGSSASG